MQLATALTILIVVAVTVIVGELSFLAWKRGKEFKRKKFSWPGWREVFTLLSLTLVLTSALLFVVYASHNAFIGGDGGGNSSTVLLIKTGNSLSFLGIVFGLIGKGRGHYVCAIAGCCTLVLWIWQGITL